MFFMAFLNLRGMAIFIYKNMIPMVMNPGVFLSLSQMKLVMKLLEDYFLQMMVDVLLFMIFYNTRISV